MKKFSALCLTVVLFSNKGAYGQTDLVCGRYCCFVNHHLDSNMDNTRSNNRRERKHFYRTTTRNNSSVKQIIYQQPSSRKGTRAILIP